jgi:hypothetical protein
MVVDAESARFLVLSEHGNSVYKVVSGRRYRTSLHILPGCKR